MKSFFEDYILLNLKDYLGDGWDMQPLLWLLFLSIGLCAACFCLHVLHNAMYTAVKQTLRHGADHPSRAKTVQELGLSSRRFVCFLLRRGDGQLFRALTIADKEEISYEAYVAQEKERRKNKEKRSAALDLTQTRFYVADKQRPFADRLLATGSESVFHPIMASAAVLLVYVLIVVLFPIIASFVSSL